MNGVENLSAAVTPKYAHPEWRRIGGRRYSISLPIDTVQRCLTEQLPSEFAPYVICGEDRIPIPILRKKKHRGPVNRTVLYRCPVDRLAQVLTEAPDGFNYSRSRFFIGSLKLTPELSEPMEDSDVTAWLVMCGLTGVETGVSRDDGITYAGELFAARQVLHVPSGQVKSHEEYGQLFRQICRFLGAATRTRIRSMRSEEETQAR